MRYAILFALVFVTACGPDPDPVVDAGTDAPVQHCFDLKPCEIENPDVPGCEEPLHEPDGTACDGGTCKGGVCEP